MGGGRKSRGRRRERDGENERKTHGGVWSLETRESPERSLERTSARGTARGNREGGEKEKDRALCCAGPWSEKRRIKTENRPVRRSKKREREVGCCERGRRARDESGRTAYHHCRSLPPSMFADFVCVSVSWRVFYSRGPSVHQRPRFSLSLRRCLPPATARLPLSCFPPSFSLVQLTRSVFLRVRGGGSLVSQGEREVQQRRELAKCQ